MAQRREGAKASNALKTPAKKSPKSVGSAAGARLERQGEPDAQPKKKPHGLCLYRPELHPQLVKAWATAGRTNKQIAEELKISERALGNWVQKYPELMLALKEGRVEPDEHVERSLYSRATGYSFPSEKIVVVSDGQGNGSHIERVPIVEHCPPEVVACIFWLKNRRPDRWRDRQELAHSGSVETKQALPDLTNLSDTERDGLLLSLVKAIHPEAPK